MEKRVVLLDRAYADAELSAAGPLDLRNVDGKGFDKIVALCRASDLHLYHLKLAGLDGIERLESVTSLELHWANKVTSLSPVFKMLRLRQLRVVDFPRLPAIDGIEALVSLRSRSRLWLSSRTSLS